MPDTPCYELRYPNGEPVDTGDCIPHFRTEKQASAAAAHYRIKQDGFGTPAPHQLDTPCVPGLVCTGCGEADDEVNHFASMTDAEEHLRAAGWTVMPRAARCPSCAPPPPAQRAPGAGQLTLGDKAGNSECEGRAS